MKPRHWDGLLITHPPNVRYLCGFTGSAGTLILTARGSAFFTDGRYRQQAKTEVHARQAFFKGAALQNVAEWIKAQGFKNIAFEGDHLSAADHAAASRKLGSRVGWHDANCIVERQRMIKDAAEIACLRSAAALGVDLLRIALKHLAPGVRECEVAAELEYAARKRGAEGMSFETIVAAGKRSALPHGRATSAPLPRRGFVVLDYGVILSGHCSDMTRTVHLGPPDKRARRLYEAVHKAQEAALTVAGPGIPAEKVDAAARRVLRAEGFGRYFTHSTGHGVGLEIHELPRLAAGQKEPLRPGMIITVEPGAYVPGYGGVRIEDMVLVTDRGSEVLTRASKELLVV